MRAKPHVAHMSSWSSAEWRRQWKTKSSAPRRCRVSLRPRGRRALPRRPRGGSARRRTAWARTGRSRRRLGVDVEVVGRAEDAPGSVKSAGGVCSRRCVPAASAERKCPRDAGPNAATVCRSAWPSSASTETSGPTSKPCVSAPWCARRDGDRPRRDERRRPGIGRRAAVDRKDDGGVRGRERDELPPRGERDGRDDRPLDADAGGALPRGKDKRVAARAKPQDAVGVCPRAGPEADGEGSAAATKTHLAETGLSAVLRRKPRTTSARGGGQDGKGLRGRRACARRSRTLRGRTADCATAQTTPRTSGDAMASERRMSAASAPAHQQIQIVGSQKEPSNEKKTN